MHLVSQKPRFNARATDHAAKIAMPFIGDLVTSIWAPATSSGRQPKDVEFAKQTRRVGERERAQEPCSEWQELVKLEP